MSFQYIKRILVPSAFKAGLLTTLLCCVIYFFLLPKKPEILSAFDTQITDFMFHIRGAVDSSGSVVIVDIDENSLKEYGQWPWPRDLVHQLTKNIIAADPVAFGFDLIFSEKDRSSPATFLQHYKSTLNIEDYSTLAELEKLFPALPNYDKNLGEIFQSPQIIQGYRFLFREDFLKKTDQAPHITHKLNHIPLSTSFDEVLLITAYRPILNIPELRKGGSEGFLNLFHDESGTVRKAPLFLLMDNIPYPSIVMEMFQIAQHSQSATLLLSPNKKGKYYAVQGVTLGNDLFKTDDFGQVNINFRGPSNTFLYLSASDVLNGSEVSFLQGKHVILGSTASGMIDLVSTPFSSRMPGVEVHANILDNLIKNDTLTRDKDLEHWLTFVLILSTGVAISASLVYLHPLVGFIVSGSLFFSLPVGNYYLLFTHHKLVDFSFIYCTLIFIITIVVLCNYFFEGKKRLFIKRAFSHYVSPAVVGELMKNPKKLDLRVNTKEVSVLFCDIRDFTTLAENTSPAELSLFLNTYFSLLTDIIIKHNGMVDKYIGDAIMAVWGTPLEDAQHASNAVRAALEMVAATEQHKDELTLAGEVVRVGIGINSGLVSAGNFGCSRRFDYTVLGDNVNLASRIEELTKYYPVKMLITQSTRSLLQFSSSCRYVDTVQVKGRSTPVDLFEPLAADTTKLLTTSQYSKYLEAIEFYRKGDFKEAATLFSSLFISYSDPLYEMYRDRCLKFCDNPSAKKWCGIYPHS